MVVGEAALNQNTANVFMAASSRSPAGQIATNSHPKKSASPALASLVLLTPENSLQSSQSVDEAGNMQDPSLYLDTIPSVEGVAFFESRVPATENLNARSEIYTYTVEEGDTPASIADLFGISLNTLFWANNLTARMTIRTGQQLTILPVNGVSHTVVNNDTVASLAQKFNVPADDIIAYNNLSSDAILSVGTVLVIPDGAPPISTPVRQVAIRPVNVTKSLVNVPAGWLIQPAPGYNWGRLHGFNGDDIANSCGTPIVAAAAGTVIVAIDSGWNGGYGKYIKIQHANGVITLYAHAKELFVDPGVAVNQGETIALMGTTGNSTGCHVHFEVRGAKNPFVRR